MPLPTFFRKGGGGGWRGAVIRGLCACSDEYGT